MVELFDLWSLEKMHKQSLQKPEHIVIVTMCLIELKLKDWLFLTQFNSEFEIEHFELIEFHQIRNMEKTTHRSNLTVINFQILPSGPLRAWNSSFVIKRQMHRQYLVVHHLLYSFGIIRWNDRRHFLLHFHMEIIQLSFSVCDDLKSITSMALWVNTCSVIWMNISVISAIVKKEKQSMGQKSQKENIFFGSLVFKRKRRRRERRQRGISRWTYKKGSSKIQYMYRRCANY